MKNLTIKKVALGVFLAGYAASSAFAASLDATSANVIYGNAPSISSLKDLNTSKESRTAHRLSVRITTDEAGKEPVGTGSDDKNKSKKIHVGNYVHLKYNLDDLDNDSEKATEGSIVKTIKIFKMIKVSNVDTWSDVGNVTALNVTYKTETDDNNKTYAVIRFQITDEFSGAEKIGFKLLESTEFGLPAVNSWVSVSDILSEANPKVDSAIEGNGHSVTNPDKDGPETSEIQKGDYGSGDPDPNKPIGPVVGKDFVVGLFGYDGGAIDLTKNYKITNEPLHYGQKYSVLVWKDEGTKDNLPQFPQELDVTTKYAYEWFLVGTVDGVAAETTALTSQLTKRVQDNDTILLGADPATNAAVERNSIYGTTYKAGAQGFNLKVTAD